LEPRDARVPHMMGRRAGPARGMGARGEPSDNDEIRRKIEMLRLALRAGVSSPGGAGGGGGGLAREARDPEALGKAGGGGDVGDGEGARKLEGASELSSSLGRCLVIERELTACPSLEAISGAHRALAGGEARAAGAPSGFAFLDLETTGLSATPLFLAGMLVERAGALRAVQLLARDYSEERCLIGALDELLGTSRICVTFNGKSFDLPYLRERAKYHRLPLKAEPEQFDLLHYARRRWKHDLPDCRLLTLEWYILGRRRAGDVEGWEVPCIYHEFVHTKDATRLRGVLRHNLMDVLAMAELLVSLAEGQ